MIPTQAASRNSAQQAPSNDFRIKKKLSPKAGAADLASKKSQSPSGQQTDLHSQMKGKGGGLSSAAVQAYFDKQKAPTVNSKTRNKSTSLNKSNTESQVNPSATANQTHSDMMASAVTAQSIQRQGATAAASTKSQSPTPKQTQSSKGVTAKTGLSLAGANSRIEKTGSSKKLFGNDRQKTQASSGGGVNQSQMAEYYSRNERSNKGSPDSTSQHNNTVSTQKNSATTVKGIAQTEFMKRRTSDEKKQQNSPPKQPPQSQIMYQDFLKQKSKSPENVIAAKQQPLLQSQAQHQQNSMFKKVQPVRQVGTKSPSDMKAASKSPTDLKNRGNVQVSPTNRLLVSKTSAGKRQTTNAALKSPPKTNQTSLPLLKPAVKKPSPAIEKKGKTSQKQIITVPQQDENTSERDDFVEDEFEESPTQQPQTASEKKRSRELLRQLWIATEKDEMMTCLKLLKKEEPSFAKVLINQQNTDGWTPLHVASNEGHVDLIDLFVEYGSNIDARSRNFRTPLHVASIRGNLGVIQAVLMAGADINAKDIDGNTPCHFCAEYGYRDCLRYLLHKHPSLFSKNKEGLSPYDSAVSTEILQIFQEYITSVKNIVQQPGAASRQPTTPQQECPDPNVGTYQIPPGAHSQKPNTTKPRSSTHMSKQSDSSDTASTLPAKVEEHQMTQQLQKPATKKGTVPSAVVKTRVSSSSGGSSTTPTTQPQQKQRLAQVDQKKQKSKNVQIHDSQLNSTLVSHLQDATNQPYSEDTPLPDDSSDSLLVTDKVGPEDFMPLKLLGSGSFGEVYLVRQVSTGELYAMKVLSKQKILGQNLVRYAKTERDVLSYTVHNFIVSLNYAFQTRTKLFLILDFCPGGDLGRLISKEGRLSEDLARVYLAEILLALEDLHRRDIIYRDLKPDNVVIDDEGHAQLTDFGLSKEGVLEVNNGAISFCGSVAYLSPEMLRKAGHGKSVDWYLLGVLLYEMLVGKTPYFSDSKTELFHNIQRGPLKLPISMSQDAKNIIVNLLNRNPSKRLGAGPDGSDEIKRHPFFECIDWEKVANRAMPVPKPRYTLQYHRDQFKNVICTEEQKRNIFEDFNDVDNVNNRQIDGWSFVGEAAQQLTREKSPARPQMPQSLPAQPGVKQSLSLQKQKSSQ